MEVALCGRRSSGTFYHGNGLPACSSQGRQLLPSRPSPARVCSSCFPSQPLPVYEEDDQSNRNDKHDAEDQDNARVLRGPVVSLDQLMGGEAEMGHRFCASDDWHCGPKPRVKTSCPRRSKLWQSESCGLWIGLDASIRSGVVSVRWFTSKVRVRSV